MQTPVYDTDKVGKPRKRLVKKGGSMGKESMDEEANFGREGSESDGNKRKKKEKRHKDKHFGGGGVEKGTVKKLGKSEEVNEMWNWVNPEIYNRFSCIKSDKLCCRCLPVLDRYGSDNEARSPGAAPQETGCAMIFLEEDDEDPEIKEFFKVGKKRKKNEISPAEIALLVDSVMAELEVTAEEDAELNRQGKPAINKLKKLPLLTEVLSKKQLQPEFLDHGVLTLLKNWLEPLPDGSLPNINIRAAILQILTDFPIDLEQHDRREQLKRNGLGKVIMFLSKSDEETTSNRKLAKDLVDKWGSNVKATSEEFLTDFQKFLCRPANRYQWTLEMVILIWIFLGTTSLVDHHQVKMLPGLNLLQGNMLHDQMQHQWILLCVPSLRLIQMKLGLVQNKLHKISVMNKKLQQLKAPKKKQLQATKLSVEGRGMLKYL
ncbi:hypothetical protein F3Y22_tig00110206pilonHSYRG00431 [Hibiscus syriacus]|uniref:TFIIS N-terminal domain-containing protein n=1 Tax=Hibiscus syriacus TaxID=106335 RepID=A0A6A3BD78_HIBSY|nr:hypothetical protein F3Y22_tig00110206pilonHSYRG00431 [Hibiscus syriacus]